MSVHVIANHNVRKTADKTVASGFSHLISNGWYGTRGTDRCPFAPPDMFPAISDAEPALLAEEPEVSEGSGSDIEDELPPEGDEPAAAPKRRPRRRKVNRSVC